MTLHAALLFALLSSSRILDYPEHLIPVYVHLRMTSSRFHDNSNYHHNVVLHYLNSIAYFAL